MIERVERAQTPGERLRILRAKKNQSAFAKELGVNANSYSMYERGERAPDWHFLRRLKDLTSADINWLLTGEMAKLDQGDAPSLLASADGTLDAERLKEAVVAAHRGAATLGKTYPSAVFADIVLSLYSLSLKHGKLDDSAVEGVFIMAARATDSS